MFVDEYGNNFELFDSAGPCRLTIGQRMALWDLYIVSQFRGQSDDTLRDAIMDLYRIYVQKNDIERGVAPSVFTTEGGEEKLEQPVIMAILHQLATSNPNAYGKPDKLPITSDNGIMADKLVDNIASLNLMSSFREGLIRVGDAVSWMLPMGGWVTSIVSDITPEGVLVYFPSLGWPNQGGLEFLPLAQESKKVWHFPLSYDEAPMTETLPALEEIEGAQLRDLAMSCRNGDSATAENSDDENTAPRSSSMLKVAVGVVMVAGGIFMVSRWSEKS